MFKSKPTISNVTARQILDSRGIPTIEVRLQTSDGVIAVSQVPSGASTGKHEATELRDGGAAFYGKGVLNAVENVNTEIAKAIKGFDVTDQDGIDARLIKLDGTPAKSRLGGNALTGVSQAAARAGAAVSGLPLYKYLFKLLDSRFQMDLPRPMFNLINGGLHADNQLEVQEFLFIPLANTFSEGVRTGVETYHGLTDVLRKKGLYTGVGDEGGHAPKLNKNADGFEFIIEAATKAGHKLTKDYALAIDAAANSFLSSNSPFKYNLKLDGKELTTEELVDLYVSWIEKYKLVSIEDGLAEDDKEGWKLMTRKLAGDVHLVKQKVELVGDDLFVTSAKRLIDGAHDKIGTAIIIKPNQIGTISETINTVRTARELGYACIASHRSGDTNDDFIADLSVGFGCAFIKAGAPARGERVSKYNRLLEIDKELHG